MKKIKILIDGKKPLLWKKLQRDYKPDPNRVFPLKDFYEGLSKLLKDKK